MRTLLLSFLFYLLLQSTANGSVESDRDADLAALVASISTVHDGSGISQSDTELVRRLQAYKASAIPYLLPLLESKEKRIRDFAGYVLRDQKGITEEHLPALIAALKRGNGWIPPAIGRIRTPAAIRSLVANLESYPESNTQVTFALALAGEPAVPYLVALLGTRGAASDDLSDTLCQIFADINSETSSDLLLKIASDARVGRTNRLHAVKDIGCIRGNARRAIPALQKMAAADPVHFGPVVDATIMKIGTAESVPYFVKALRSTPDIQALRQIAALHENGRAAGPVLVEFLVNLDPALRVGAARALGYIGYTPAAKQLLPLLQVADDWELAFVTAESLGRIQAQQAIPALERLASSHWYPPVVTAASFAIKVIKGEAAYASPQDTFPQAFFEFQDPVDVSSGFPPRLPRPASVNMPGTLTKEALAKLRYDIETFTWNRGGKRIQRSSNSPTCGLKTADGYIVGRDSGEWGGELAWVTEHSSTKILLKENTHGIYRLPFGILAVTGLAHLNLNHGAIFLVEPVESGGYRAKRWQRLSGAPSFSGQLVNGNLFISTVGGDVVITPEGRIEMATTGNTSGTAGNF